MQESRVSGLGWGRRNFYRQSEQLGDGEVPAVKPHIPLIWKTLNPQRIKNL